MKSREGTVVDADDLMDEVVEKAAEMTKARGHIETLSETERSKLFEQIGLGGLKYYLLKVDPKKRMMFNPEESIDLTGNTGPFIQYAHARISTLLERAGTIDLSNVQSAQIVHEEKEIIKLLTQFPDVIHEAAIGFSPAIVANYIYDLVKNYNHFYQAVKILSEENAANKNLRLAMSECVRRTIQQSLQVLGIQAPMKM
jgi:arginyl-tRNA synthetase